MGRARKERKAAARAAEAEAREKAGAAGQVAVKFNTVEEANEALHETAKVINMADRQKAAAAKSGKKLTGAAAGSVQAKAKREANGLPGLPKKARVRATRPCECGCGGTTKARFVPGHDSYLRGIAIRIERGVMKIEDIAPPKFKAAQREAVKEELRKRALRAKSEIDRKPGSAEGKAEAVRTRAARKRAEAAKVKGKTKKAGKAKKAVAEPVAAPIAEMVVEEKAAEVGA